MQKIFLVVFLACTAILTAKSQSKEYFQLKIYHLKTKIQEERIDRFLQNAWLPAVHRAGIKNIGVFKQITPDTVERLVYVLIPFKSFKQFENLDRSLEKDRQYAAAGKDYIDAAYNEAPYVRMESILMQAFSGMPRLQPSPLTGPRSERVYELRSYEGPTEKYYINKVKMFNDGDEVGLFKRLGFNAVFYAEVISGSRMPNLMYMTSFDSKASRDEHWKTFSNDEQWKKLRVMSEYQNNVSKIDIMFLYPTEYSDY
ncbi:MAG: NIPSNAP family protein [Chitinophagaceae bacterium]